MAAVSALLAGTGCYEGHATALGSVQPGETVNVALTPSGLTALSSIIGHATTLDGRMLGGDADQLRLAVTQIERSIER